MTVKKPAAMPPTGPLSRGTPADPLVEALRDRLAFADTVTIDALESTWADELVVIRTPTESMSVYIPSPHASRIDPTLAEVAGRWVCERGGSIIPSRLGGCAAVDDVAAWASRVVRAELRPTTPTTATAAVATARPDCGRATR